MLTIMKIEAGSNGGHALQSQSHREECWLEGWVAVPEEMARAVWDCGGYCDLTVEDGILTAVTPKERPAPPDPEPTEEERLRADVDYILAMEGLA